MMAGMPSMFLPSTRTSWRWSTMTWAAQSLMNVVVREGQTQAGSICTLIKGTLLRGQITEGPGHRPSGGAMVMLIEKGEPLPKDFRGLNGNKGQLMRATAKSDAEGRYQFRVGPGRYTVQRLQQRSLREARMWTST